MTTTLLGVVLGPLAAAILGWQLVLRTLPAAVARYLEERPMSDTHPSPGATGDRGARGERGQDGPRGRREPVSRIFVVILIASVLVITIGVQALMAGNQQEDRDRADARRELADKQHDRQVEVCTQTWADAYRDTTETRVDSNTALRKANKQWATSVGGVFTVFIAALAAPPRPEGAGADPVLLDDLTTALTTFAEKDAARKAAERNVTDTAEQNPYPPLDLSCPEGRAAAKEITS